MKNSIAGAYNGNWDLGLLATHGTIDEEAFNEKYGRVTPLDILTKFQEQQ